ncbi:MAG: UDP-N-acetylglucosamine 1-carboxyvinyltransferase [Oscillospiraceae bacterium]|jgi:UDP-N-acetylglucosamine 1-carboxyvinyltransferase|nr:UDP-N-acetylglucosamine 1-carboxyvinyltransferase [Oscillospiraceae bacterium]
MSVLRIAGGSRLNGSVRVHGAKNSVLPILAATLVGSGESVIRNCPEIADVEAAFNILRHIGCTARRDGGEVVVGAADVTGCEIPHSLMREMRSSVIFLGAILGRCGKAVISSPGGCELGPRPVDMHLAALRELGADVSEESGNIICRCGRLRGAKITLRLPSVGATENTMLAACFADGTTVISNAAREPENSDLQSFLRELGVSVYGAGTSTVTVEGNRVKTGAEHRVIPDRIAAATYACAAAATAGDIEITDAEPRHLASVLSALRGMGCAVSVSHDRIRIAAPEGLSSLPPISTEPYPGFPTDAQAQLMAVSLKAQGTTSFIENIFQSRYAHALEMRRFGANIKIEGKVALVTGVAKLAGAPVTAPDLRGGAALVIAGLSAEGITEVSEPSHIDRGYECIESSLREIGADIERI